MTCLCRVLFALVVILLLGQAVQSDTECYFRARVTDATTFPLNSVAIFNKVELEECATAYDKTTGEFTAPVTGIYEFMFHFQSKSEGEAVFKLYVGNKLVMGTAIEEEMEPASFTTILRVNKDEKVYVKRTDGTSTGPMMLTSTQFAGYLLYEDDDNNRLMFH